MRNRDPWVTPFFSGLRVRWLLGHVPQGTPLGEISCLKSHTLQSLFIQKGQKLTLDILDTLQGSITISSWRTRVPQESGKFFYFDPWVITGFYLKYRLFFIVSKGHSIFFDPRVSLLGINFVWPLGNMNLRKS